MQVTHAKCFSKGHIKSLKNNLKFIWPLISTVRLRSILPGCKVYQKFRKLFARWKHLPLFLLHETLTKACKANFITVSVDLNKKITSSRNNHDWIWLLSSLLQGQDPHSLVGDNTWPFSSQLNIYKFLSNCVFLRWTATYNTFWCWITFSIEH